ncbi:MAG: hypothetical protein QM680_00570 [Luteolibacter sp.]
MAVWEIKFVHPEWAGGEITTGPANAQDFFMKYPQNTKKAWVMGSRVMSEKCEWKSPVAPDP